MTIKEKLVAGLHLCHDKQIQTAETSLVMPHETDTSHVINEAVETVIITSHGVVIVKAIDINLTQLELVVCIYSKWISVYW